MRVLGKVIFVGMGLGKGEERTGALWAGFLGDLGRGFIFTEPKIKIKLEIVKRMGFEVR